MNLRSFREDKLKIKTQAEFAKLIGVEQSSISRWEKDPSSITIDIIQRILDKTGATFQELTGWEKPRPAPLNVEDTWKKADFTKRTISDYVAGALKTMDLPEDIQAAYVDDLKAGIAASLVKPKVAIVGRSDTGKSTLINALLGTDKMPTAWTPTTSIAVYIKHSSDKPAFIEEDAWIFADHCGNETLWNERRLYDEAYCRSWKIAAGGAEILGAFGTRQGESYGKAAGSAVVFLDAPVLKDCDIVDLPGFGTETESDDDITFAAARKADVILYLSQANGFMRIEDITYLKRNISELPVWEKNGENTLKPLANLFIVASQAHTVNNGNRAQLTEILDVGCRNLLKTLPEGYWDGRANASGYAYSADGQRELRARCFAYTVDIPDLCRPFLDELARLLEALPDIIHDGTKKFVRRYTAARRPALTGEIRKYEGIVAERDKYERLLTEIEKNELKRAQDNDARKEDIRAEIGRLRRETVSEFSAYTAKVVSVDALVSLMREKGVRNKKDDVELFGSALQSMIQAECGSILERRSETLSAKTKEYVTEYAEGLAKSFEKIDLNVDFDAGWAFASALSAVGMLGGFGTFLASTVSGILLLNGAGLSFGATVLGAALTSSVFGPIGIAFGLLVAAGLGIVKLFGGGWEKSVAKKIVAAFEERDFNGAFIKGINTYWDETEAAFDCAAARLDEAWEAYVSDLRATVASYDICDIQQRIAALKNLASFFENIPL